MLRARAAVLLLAPALPSCRANPAAEALSAGEDRTEGEAARAPRSPEEVRLAAFRRAIDEAGAFLREADLAAARDRLERLRGRAVPPEVSAALDALEILLEAREWEARLAGACRAEPVRSVVEAGDPILVRLKFSNPGPSEIRVAPLEGEGGARALVTLSVRFLERRPDGTDYRESFTDVFSFPAFALGPGEETERLRNVPPPAEAAFALRDYEIAAEVRPVRFAAGGKHLPLRGIPLSPCSVRVYPRGYGAIAAAPYAALRKALAAADPTYDRHVLVAAALVPPGERERAIATCVEALFTGEPRRRRSAAAALRLLCGRDDLPPDPDVWRSLPSLTPAAR